MSFTPIILALALLLAVPAAARAEGDGTSSDSKVRAEIMPSFEAMQAAANVHDTDAHVAFIAKDPQLIFVIGDRRIIGWQAVLDQQRKWWPGGRIDPRTEAEIPYKLAAGPDFVVLGPESALLSFMLDAPKTNADGTRIDRMLAITQLWQKRPEGWRVIYVHESVTEKPSAR